ncbi:MAG: bifunctional oligoribonuclease/PAP phosphatase NrnA [candidate division Zixibacteria bacterium]|nr:bifunctional oligoribonuclease/PAP phosphatase NrnA [candidate division Zixibacteria bacterium]
MWSEVEQFIATHRRFVVTSHVNPDGDSIGSALGLCELLRGLGKEAMVIMGDPTPMVYRWLDPEQEIRSPACPEDHIHIHDADAIFVVDVNGWERLGTIGNAVRDAKAAKAVIDHHPYRELITPLSVVRTEASSTSELVFGLIDHIGVPLTLRAADALYTGVLTDTGSFRFSNSTSAVHAIAARLLEAGVQPARVYDLVYNQNSEARTRLMGRVLSDIHFAGNGQVAWLVVTQAMIKEAAALPEDTSGFVDITMTLAGVEIGIIFVEAPEQTVRVSLRSRGNKDVNRVAVALGGGGHKNASGVVLKESMDTAVEKVIATAVETL